MKLTNNILVVDDEPKNIQLIANYLKDYEDYKVMFATSGEQALNILNNNTINLVLLDVMMPEMDGFSTCNKIKNNTTTKNIPVIFLTAKDDYESLEKAYSVGGVDYIIKPVRKLELIARVRTHISLHQLKNDLEEKVNQRTAELQQSVAILSSYKDTVNAASMVSKTDLKGNITYANKDFLSYIGFEEKELIGKSHNILRCNETTNLFYKNLWDTITNKEIWRGLIKNKKKNGDEVYFQTVISSIFDKDAEIIEYVASRKDVTEILHLTDELEKTQTEILCTIGSIAETRSEETSNHVKRVALYTELLAKNYGLNSEEVEEVKLASVMHDIGKIGIPDSILNKPAALTKDEFEIMKSHAQIGYDIFKSSNKKLLKTAAIIAGEHHEKYDGTGYPNGKKSDAIHIYGRIVAIADVVDALGTNRVYKKAWEFDDIVQFVKDQSGKHFDPILVDIFINHIDEILEIRENCMDDAIDLNKAVHKCDI